MNLDITYPRRQTTPCRIGPLTIGSGHPVMVQSMITEETRNEMRRMLKEIQDGTYARNWIAEDKNGRPWFNETRNREQHHQIEEVGAKLRALMPFLKPVKRPEPAGVA